MIVTVGLYLLVALQIMGMIHRVYKVANGRPVETPPRNPGLDLVLSLCLSAAALAVLVAAALGR